MAVIYKNKKLINIFGTVFVIYYYILIYLFYFYAYYIDL